eukprot:m.261011 g.261011  ORF g.261011 m.261011 type:complete len:806 (+) comp19685_c0_seq1:259-2676(+)
MSATWDRLYLVFPAILFCAVRSSEAILVTPSSAVQIHVPGFRDGHARAIFGANKLVQAINKVHLHHMMDAVATITIEESTSVNLTSDGVVIQLDHVTEDIARYNGVVHHEGYIIQKLSNRSHGYGLRIVSSGMSGLMYGSMRLAEMIEHQCSMFKTIPFVARLNEMAFPIVVRRPNIFRRGLKMNVPLDARTPSYGDAGDSAQHNIPTMWNMTFWEKYLDSMASHHYNFLSLWSLDPWSSIIRFQAPFEGMHVDDVMRSDIDWIDFNKHNTDTAMVTQEVLDHLVTIQHLSIDEKINFWRSVMSYANDRGISVMIVTWNIFVFPILNNETSPSGVNISQVNPVTKAWVRQAVNRTFCTYPLLAGIGTDPGERMNKGAAGSTKEEWIWETYGLGIQDALQAQPQRNLTKPVLLIRQNSANLSRIIELFDPILQLGVDFVVGAKYAHNAHMFGSTHPSFARDSVLPILPPNVKALWCLRNDDMFNFRWGNPAYVSEYYANMPADTYTDGIHIGADGYVFAETWADKTVQKQLEIEKHWYNFKAWGLLAYDSTMNNETYWLNVLVTRFPELQHSNMGAQAAASLLQTGWTNASRVVPVVNRMVVGSWINDFQWNPEGCFSRSGYTGIAQWAKAEPVPENNLTSFADYVTAMVHGRPIPPYMYNPVDMILDLRQAADISNRSARALEASLADADIGSELRATLHDIKTFAALGLYYAAKTEGTIEWQQGIQSKNSTTCEKGVQSLQAAISLWKQYAMLASEAYVSPQLLGRVGLMDWIGFTNGTMDDVATAKQSCAVVQMLETSAKDIN